MYPFAISASFLIVGNWSDGITASVSDIFITESNNIIRSSINLCLVLKGSNLIFICLYLFVVYVDFLFNNPKFLIQYF